jgi:hypothetical protein
MKPMTKRLAAWCGLMFLTGTMACAQGVPADPPTQIDVPPPVVEPLCGNGKLDQGEQCDCANPMATGQCKVDGAMCSMYKGPTSVGTVLCNAKPLCTLNLDSCSGGPAGAMGGTGSTATAGTGAMTSGVTGTGGTGRR